MNSNSAFKSAGYQKVGECLYRYQTNGYYSRIRVDGKDQTAIRQDRLDTQVRRKSSDKQLFFYAVGTPKVDGKLAGNSGDRFLAGGAGGEYASAARTAFAQNVAPFHDRAVVWLEADQSPRGLHQSGGRAVNICGTVYLDCGHTISSPYRHGWFSCYLHCYPTISYW